jgi:hypothetical protein
MGDSTNRLVDAAEVVGTQSEGDRLMPKKDSVPSGDKKGKKKRDTVPLSGAASTQYSAKAGKVVSKAQLRYRRLKERLGKNPAPRLEVYFDLEIDPETVGSILAAMSDHYSHLSDGDELVVRDSGVLQGEQVRA